MTEYERTYCLHNPTTNEIEWFFDGRKAEGTIGPFANQNEAKKALEIFIKLNIQFNDDGGRSASFLKR
jgi:hypothetical protein